MTATRKIVAIGVVAALGVIAWTSLRTPDRAPARPGESAPGSAIPAGSAPRADAAPAPAAQAREGQMPARQAVAAADMPRYLRGLDQAQVAARFGEMLDPGDCSRVIDANGRIMRCNAQGLLNQRLQGQLENPDPRWTPQAQRALQGAVDAAVERAQGRLRTIDLRCGRDVCQILTVAPLSDDRSPADGWNGATRAFRDSPWWRELGFTDMRLSMMSGPDGRTVYYVTQLTTRPRP